MSWSISATWLLLAAVLAAGCVDDAETAKPETTYPLSMDDTPFYSAPDCTPDNAQLYPIETFELGAAAGTFFANNEICEDCAAINLDASTQETPYPALTVEQRKQAYTLCQQACRESMTPTIFDKPLPASAIPGGGRCGSRYALHLMARDLIDWGANVGDNFSAPVDASQYDGIAFYARRASTSRGVVRLELGDIQTTNNPNDPTSCILEGSRDELFKRCDRHGGYLNITTDWKLFKLPFSELRQSGFGKPAGNLDITGIHSLTFLFPAGDWDLWIDDISWYKEETP